MYCSSKAALISASESWRRELAPLGVRVIALVAGGIATNFIANLNVNQVPATSHYYSVKEAIEQVDKPENTKYFMPAEEFALQLMKKVEGGASGKIWLGGGVTMTRWLLWLLPIAWLVSCLRVRLLECGVGANGGLQDLLVESIQRPFSKKLAVVHNGGKKAQ
jgi:1-acylglycerone phosphate reductase